MIDNFGSTWKTKGGRCGKQMADHVIDVVMVHIIVFQSLGVVSSHV